MNKHHTKAKGDLAVLKAQLDLHQQGFWVAVPLTENAPFDLIINRDGVSQTVQVKHARMVRGCVIARLVTTWSDKKGIHEKPIDKTLVDLYCLYCPDTDCCYYLRPAAVPNTRSVSLRLVPAANGQVKGVMWADEYRNASVAQLDSAADFYSAG